MWLLLLLAVALLLLASVLFFYPRKLAKETKEIDATVYCKKCGARIAVSNPSKLRGEFSVECTACQTRKIYKPVDLKSGST
jgi:DNA-directed RNA polymerase subunit RPC12/RpoP